MAVIVKRLEVNPSEQRYKFFWLKYVTDLNFDEHCQRCLLGPVSKRISTGLVATVRSRTVWENVRLDEADSKLLYLCGYSQPQVWDHNFHLPLMVQEGGKVTKKWRGVYIELEGCIELPIEAAAVPKDHAKYKDYKFRTCRNWQFAWCVQKGLYLPPSELIRQGKQQMEFF
jgi:hypothetical protein